MHRRALLATATSIGLTALAGCTSDETERPDRVTLEIDTEDSWNGTTSTDDGSRKISGRGGETLEWTQPLPSNIRVTLKKGPSRTSRSKRRSTPTAR